MSWATVEHWMGRRVLVTGASGMLGSALCEALASLGAEVHGTWRSRPPPECLTADWPATLPGDGAELIGRLRPEVIFHLASPIRLERDPSLYPLLRRGILDATVEISEAALRGGHRLVVAGTCEEYGDGRVPCREEQAPRPVSPYSALKAAATAWVQSLCTLGLQATVLRPFRAYGPRDEQSLVGQACRAALEGRVLELSDGAQTREWNAAEDLALGMIEAAACPGAIGRVINLGGGPEATVRQVVEQIWDLAGADPALLRFGARPRRPGELDRFCADVSLAQQLWGGIAHRPLEEGLAELLAWHQARPLQRLLLVPGAAGHPGEQEGR
jgi:UDP-glucose 4-epimerase